MYYINSKGTNHGNPMHQPFDSCVTLPDELLGAYLDCMGFCAVTVDEQGTVTAVMADEAELAAYKAEHPDTQPEEPVTVEELAAQNATLKQQVAALADQQSFYEDCIAEMAQIVYA